MITKRTQLASPAVIEQQTNVKRICCCSTLSHFSLQSNHRPVQLHFLNSRILFNGKLSLPSSIRLRLFHHQHLFQGQVKLQQALPFLSGNIRSVLQKGFKMREKVLGKYHQDFFHRRVAGRQFVIPFTLRDRGDNMKLKIDVCTFTNYPEG